MNRSISSRRLGGKNPNQRGVFCIACIGLVLLIVAIVIQLMNPPTGSGGPGGPTQVGIIELKTTTASCGPGFVRLVGPLLGSDSESYYLCVKKGGEGVKDANAFLKETDSSPACGGIAGWNIIQGFVGSDNSNYDLCIPSESGAGLLDIVTVWKRTDDTACDIENGYTLLKELKGTDDRTYLVCVQRQLTEGIADIKRETGDCAEAYVSLGNFTDPTDESQFNLCVRKDPQNPNIMDIAAPELTDLANPTCPEEIPNPVTPAAGPDDANYNLCVKTGGPGLLDIVSLKKESEDTVCDADAFFQPLVTLAGTDMSDYLICVKKGTLQDSNGTGGECPETCRLDAATACGAAITLPAECAAFSCPTIGSMCQGPDEPQTQFCNTTLDLPVCQGQGDFDCGVLIPGTEILGVRCGQGSVCNLEKGGCVIVAEALAAPKYEFDLFAGTDFAEAINACYAYTLDDETVATGRKLHISIGNQAAEGLSFSVDNSKLATGLGKGGVLPFGISNGSLSGLYNYAELRVTDFIAGDPDPISATNSLIVKIKARDAGICYSEGGLAGLSGPAAKPRISYNWKFNDETGIKIDSCDESKADGSQNANFVYCDATQFSIELSKKLANIVNAAESGSPVAADSALLDFNAYLLPDGYTADFRSDFDYLQGNVVFFEPNAAYQKIKPYFVDPLRMVFTPDKINRAGKYNVKIFQNFAASKQNIFFENDLPIATVFVTFSSPLEQPMSGNMLYQMPVDYAVGTVVRTGETEAGRTGYGIGFTSPVRITSELTVPAISATESLGNFDLETDADFAGSLDPAKRGIVLRITPPTDSGNGKLIFSASNATPVLMEIPMQNNSAEAFVQLVNGQSAVNVGSLPIGLWTGAGSTTGNSCADFAGNPLGYNRPDTSPDAASCAANDPVSRGFAWAGNANNTNVYFKTVVYTPPGESFQLKQSESCKAGFTILTPAETTTPSQSVVNLGYFTQDFTILSNVLENLVLSPSVALPGFACAYNSELGSTFYWNRDRVLDILKNPSNYSPSPSHSMSDFASLGSANECAASQGN